MESRRANYSIVVQFLLMLALHSVSSTQTDMPEVSPPIWFKVWNGEDTANTICVRGEENSSHLFVGSKKLSGNDYSLCSELEFFSHKTKGPKTLVKQESAASQIWRAVHWNSSTVSSSSLTESSRDYHSVHLHNLCPIGLQLQGLKDQYVEAGSSKKVDVKKEHFKAAELKTLEWLTHIMANYMVNKNSGLVEKEKIGLRKAAMIFHDSDRREGEAEESGLISRASYSLLQATSPTTVAFHLIEASYMSSPAKQKKKQRKLLQESMGYTLDSTFACPKGYCFKLPKWKISRTCKPKAPSYSACLYRCVCN